MYMYIYIYICILILRVPIVPLSPPSSNPLPSFPLHTPIRNSNALSLSDTRILIHTHEAILSHIYTHSFHTHYRSLSPACILHLPHINPHTPTHTSAFSLSHFVLRTPRELLCVRRIVWGIVWGIEVAHVCERELLCVWGIMWGIETARVFERELLCVWEYTRILRETQQLSLSCTISLDPSIHPPLSR